MKLLKVAVPSGNEVLSIDAIEHEGKLWLVPMWNVDTALKQRWPKRVIRLDNLPHQRLLVPFGPHNAALNIPIPRRILDGGPPLEPTDTLFEIQDDPPFPPMADPQSLN